MGSFISSQADAEICEVLNKRFSDEVNPNDPQQRTYLNELRNFIQHTEDLFDTHHHLHRTYHRLAVAVAGSPGVPRDRSSRLRWFHLLNGNLPQSVEKAIRGQLSAILGPPAADPAGTVDYVTFSTVHQATNSHAQFELFDNTHHDNPKPAPQTDANNKTYCALILLCNVDQELPNGPLEDDPPQSEPGGENQIPFAKQKKPPGKRPRAKKSAVKKKKAAKKVSKKAAKKAGKGK
jgi:hypothetical protein